MAYCGLALRCITADYERYNFILRCALYDRDSQSATNIRIFVDAQLSSYGLSLNSKILVVTDNENKIHAAFKDKCVHIGCSVHYLKKQLERSFRSEEMIKSLSSATKYNLSSRISSKL